MIPGLFDTPSVPTSSSTSLHHVPELLPHNSSPDAVPSDSLSTVPSTVASGPVPSLSPLMQSAESTGSLNTLSAFATLSQSMRFPSHTSLPTSIEPYGSILSSWPHSVGSSVTSLPHPFHDAISDLAVGTTHS